LEITKTTPGKKKHQTLKGFCKVLQIHIILYCGAGDAQQSNINEKKVCTLKIDAPDEFINSTTFQPSGLHQAEDLMVEKMNFNHSSLGSEKKMALPSLCRAQHLLDTMLSSIHWNQLQFLRGFKFSLGFAHARSGRAIC